MLKKLSNLPCVKCKRPIFFGKFIRSIALKKPFYQCPNCECYLKINPIKFLGTWVIGLLCFVVIIGPYREELSVLSKLGSFTLASIFLARIGLSISEYDYSK